MSFDQFVQWGFYSLISVVAVYIASEFATLSKSVDELNLKVASMLEKFVWHKRDIDELKDRVDAIEKKEVSRRRKKH